MKELNYALAFEELQTIVGEMETGDISIDELFNVTSYKKASFILEIMEKYNIINAKTDSNTIINYMDAIDSLRFQKNKQM